MKHLTILLLCIVFGWGGRMEVVKSTSQEWIGGLRESGYGTDYRIAIKVKAGSDQLQIDDLWIGEVHMKVKVIADPSNPQNAKFKKGSQVSLKAGIIYRPDADGQIRLLPADSLRKPFNFKGEGLLGYTYKGRKAYLEIGEFKKLEKIIYP